MLELRAAEVAALATMPEVVHAIRAAYTDLARGGAVSPPRHLTRFPGGWMRILPGGWSARGVVGYKEFHLVERRVRHTVTMFDSRDGTPLCVLDAGPLTALRTGATAAVAADVLAPAGAASVAVVGAGKEARAALAAFACVREVSRVRVHSPRPESREGFAREMGRQLEVEATACPTVADACRGASVVLVATASAGRVVLPRSVVGDAAHVTSIGATLPEHRELDETILEGASLLAVDTRQLVEESGDCLAVADPDALPVVELADLVSGSGRSAPAATTVFKSLGAGLQDLAAAELVYRRALEQGIGTTREPVAAARVLGAG